MNNAEMTNQQMVSQMKTERRRLRYRDAMLSVSGILLFLIIW